MIQQTVEISGFDFLINGESTAIESIEIDPSNNLVLVITLSDYIHYQDDLKINHTGGVISSEYNSVLGFIN